MNGPARVVTACAYCLLVAAGAGAQLTIQPTPPPAVSADSEPWYRAGEPVAYAGDLYYPAGPQVHFNANEMVRSGYYGNVPIYTRTTIEPYTVIFIPLAGGLMQPYERRPDSPRSSGFTMAQAPAPPGFGPALLLESTPPAAEAPAPDETSSVSEPVGTSGRVAATSVPAPLVYRRQDSPNGIFVEFEGSRWFSSGRPAPLSAFRVVRIGGYHGFPVYAERASDASTIYIPIAQGVDIVASYSKR
jgi:hypothetical protein